MKFDLSDVIKDYLIPYGTKALLALLVYIVGSWLISKFISILEKAFKRNNVDESLRPFLISVLGALLKVLLLLSIASMLGVETTSFIAILSAATLAVGLALQGSLANFAGGVLILLFKPFKVGDYIVAQGQEGFVDAVQVFTTTLRTHDNKVVTVPNGALGNGNIVNVTKMGTLRITTQASIADPAELNKARQAMLAAARADSRVLSSPAPEVLVSSLRDNGIDLIMNSWCKVEDAIPLGFHLTEQVKLALTGANIAGPNQTRFVQMLNN